MWVQKQARGKDDDEEDDEDGDDYDESDEVYVFDEIRLCII